MISSTVQFTSKLYNSYDTVEKYSMSHLSFSNLLCIALPSLGNVALLTK